MSALLQTRFQSKVHRRARAWYFEPEAETLPREQLERRQLRRLRATLKNAYENVPLHRARMGKGGVRPGDVEERRQQREVDR